ncbi:MAG: recombinase family protein, partial [Pseudomonadota bacterium]
MNQREDTQTNIDDLNEEVPEAVSYLRVSSVAQVQEGHGLESQATRCLEYAERKGYRVVETFHERAVSGGTLERPAFNAMLAFIRRRKRK